MTTAPSLHFHYLCRGAWSRNNSFGFRSSGSLPTLLRINKQGFSDSNIPHGLNNSLIIQVLLGAIPDWAVGWRTLCSLSPLVGKMSKLILLHGAARIHSCFASAKPGVQISQAKKKSRHKTYSFSWLGIVDVFQEELGDMRKAQYSLGLRDMLVRR